MIVKVTQHAKERYCQRTMRSYNNESEIIGTLTAAAVRGKKVKKRLGNAWEVEYQKLVVIVKYGQEIITVLTCLGDAKYRNWSRKQEINKRNKVRRAS